MHPLIATLLEQVTSTDAAIVENATLQLAMWLEYSNRPIARRDHYLNSRWITEAQADKRLRLTEQAEIVDWLVERVIAFEKFQHTFLIFAIGKAAACVALPSLLRLMDHLPEDYGDGVAHQIMTALTNCLAPNPAHVLLFEQANIQPRLNAIAAREQRGGRPIDRDTRRVALQLAQGIDEIISEYYESIERDPVR